MKRIYNPANGHSAPAWFVMSALILAFIPFCIWSIITCTRAGLRNAGYEMRGHVTELKRAWKSAR